MKHISTLLLALLFGLVAQAQTLECSGSGFAIGNGYVVTNHHVVEGCDAFYIGGINGDLTTGYMAKVVVVDEDADLAILKINDPDFRGYGTVPYAIRTSTIPKGSDVLGIGYPRVTEFGVEPKVNRGMINSLTGANNNKAHYQIDVPLQPGNSGGPLFDSRGDVVGINVAGWTDAQNVCYAIKASMLQMLADTKGISLPTNNTIANLSREQKIAKIERFTYLILCFKTGGSGYSSSRSSAGRSRTVNGHEYVDLGLPSGLLWATCNVGASRPEQYGWYLAWGETKPQSSNSYSWSSYKWCNGNRNSLTKYCTESEYGRVDYKRTLDRSDDAASVNWGGAWRTPTDAEWTELRTKCTWTWTGNYNGTGVSGVIFTGPNGNSIFIPAAGNRYNGDLIRVESYGGYWSASLSVYSSGSACDVSFYSDSVNRNYYSRYYGLSVRPVCNPAK